MEFPFPNRAISCPVLFTLALVADSSPPPLAGAFFFVAAFLVGAFFAGNFLAGALERVPTICLDPPAEVEARPLPVPVAAPVAAPVADDGFGMIVVITRG